LSFLAELPNLVHQGIKFVNAFFTTRGCASLTKSILNCTFHGVEIGIAFELCKYLPLSVDQVRNWQSQETTVLIAKLRVAHHDGKIQVQPVDSLADRRGSVIHGNSHYIETLSAIFLLPGCKLRQLNLATGTPRGPENKQNDFAAILLQSNLLPGQVITNKGRSWLVHEFRPSLRAQAGSTQQKDTRCHWKKAH
jgi:hypothetical protein